MNLWDTRYHSSESALTKLKFPAITTEQLKEILTKGLEEDVVEPLSNICTLVYNASSIVREPLTAITEFLDEFTAKVSDLLLIHIYRKCNKLIAYCLKLRRILQHFPQFNCLLCLCYIER